MANREVKDISASVRARLTNKARESGDELQRILIRFGVERFLYRLSISAYKEKFMLKGAALFSLWFNEPHRPTKDLDLLGFGANDIASLEETFKAICEIEGGDGIVFDPTTVKGELIREEEVYQGVRLKLIGWIGRAKVPLQVDVGFGDAVTPHPEDRDYPTLLDFPAPHLRVYPKETVVAEKFEAMVRLGEANGRMKDFWDLNYLIMEFEFDGSIVQTALLATFKSRQSVFPTDLPIALSPDFAQNPLVISRWSAFIQRNQITRATDLNKIIENLRHFFEPIIVTVAEKTDFVSSWNFKNGWM